MNKLAILLGLLAVGATLMIPFIDEELLLVPVVTTVLGVVGFLLLSEDE